MRCFVECQNSYRKFGAKSVIVGLFKYNFHLKIKSLQYFTKIKIMQKVSGPTCNQAK